MADTWTSLFDRLADDFDEVVPFFREAGARLVDLVAPPPGTRLLDVGTGRGAVAVAAAARGCRVTAVDASPRMVELLAAAYPGLDTRVMDATDLDLPDDSYDLATGGCVVHLVDDAARMLAELYRVVRPGGRVALTVPVLRLRGDRWRAFNAIVAEFEARRTLPRPQVSPVDLPAALKEAGFVDVATSTIEVRLPVADPETFWRFQMSTGFASRVEALAPADAAEMRTRALDELSRMHDHGGIVLERDVTAYFASLPTQVKEEIQP